MNISDDRALPEQAQGTWLTANTFGVLRQPPLLGRDFVAGDERPGAEPVVIIGHGIWKNRYGSDPGVLGKSLRVNGQPATIVGVMPEGMKFPDNTEIWAPFIPTGTAARRDVRPLRVFGRLADGVDRRGRASRIERHRPAAHGGVSRTRRRRVARRPRRNVHRAIRRRGRPARCS